MDGRDVGGGPVRWRAWACALAILCAGCGQTGPLQPPPQVAAR